MAYLDYFGGREAFQRGLAELAKRKRESLKMSREELDRSSGLGLDLPSCQEYEENPSLINGDVMSAIGYKLRIDLDSPEFLALATQRLPAGRELELVVGSLAELDVAA